jgi:hypothetical protein
MVKIVYHIVEHDGGWAYQANGVYSETYRTREAARGAADHAAREQRLSGEEAAISYETADGRWHEELAPGEDRPDTEVDG